MATEQSIARELTASIEEVLTWIHSMGTKGMYQPTSARLRSTALTCLVSVLADDEPKDAKSVLDQIADIAKRWATLNNANPETANTYLSRARSALEHFFEYKADPTKFKPKVRQRTERAAKGKAEETRVERTAEIIPLNAHGGEPPPRPSKAVRTFPLSRGEMSFSLPEGGLSVVDVWKLTCHLITFAEDFDPTNPTHAKLFSLVRVEGT